jgi:hypothetical protein
VDTLRTILRRDRSWRLAAADLHIHKQTLGYRIRRIEQLGGRSLNRTEDLAEWWFALRAHDLLTGHSAEPSGSSVLLLRHALRRHCWREAASRASAPAWAN